MIALDINSGSGPRRVDLLDYVEPAGEERAHDDAYSWIKALRHLRVDGETFRTRFTFRGDSLWWFAELYLHKQQAILNVLRSLAAFDALVERERPLHVTYVSGGYPGVLAHAAAARQVRYSGPDWPRSSAAFVARMDARAIGLSLAARASRLRVPRVPREHARIAAFVHRAFWRSDAGDGSAESYIGPVLKELESRLGRREVRYVGVGPQTNFRARRWWDAIAPREDKSIVPVEHYAPYRALAASRAVERERHQLRKRMWSSSDLRGHAVIRGCDCWPLVRQQLAGIALLQFPWSARVMDEAAAALAALEPEVALTYAEAGGWGRALALECRRAGVAFAGLQHGFIYRHWLNYRHEPDEILPDPRNPADRGFPFPSTTLLFDEFAARHLGSAGRFPAQSLAVTGSARLDELQSAVTALDEAAVAAARRDAGAEPGRALILFAAKEREARRALPALVAAVRDMPDVELAIKPHPAETADVYRAAVAGVANIRVLPPTAPLPPLLAAAAAIVTVNSTVAIDALSLGLPALVIGLPNNLSPFVQAGAMIGAGTAEEIQAAFGRVLYDQEFRKTNQRSMASGTVGGSAARSADTILRLTKGQ